MQLQSTEGASVNRCVPARTDGVVLFHNYILYPRGKPMQLQSPEGAFRQPKPLCPNSNFNRLKALSVNRGAPVPPDGGVLLRNDIPV